MGSRCSSATTIDARCATVAASRRVRCRIASERRSQGSDPADLSPGGRAATPRSDAMSPMSARRAPSSSRRAPPRGCAGAGSESASSSPRRPSCSAGTSNRCDSSRTYRARGLLAPRSQRLTMVASAPSPGSPAPAARRRRPAATSSCDHPRSWRCRRSSLFGRCADSTSSPPDRPGRLSRATHAAGSLRNGHPSATETPPSRHRRRRLGHNVCRRHGEATHPARLCRACALRPGSFSSLRGAGRHGPLRWPSPSSRQRALAGSGVCC